MDWVKTLGEKTTHSCEKCRLKAQVKNKRVKHEWPGSSFHAEVMHWLCCGEMYQTNLGTDFNEKLSGAENMVRGFIGKRVGSKHGLIKVQISRYPKVVGTLPLLRQSCAHRGIARGAGLARGSPGGWHARCMWPCTSRT